MFRKKLLSHLHGSLVLSSGTSTRVFDKQVPFNKGMCSPRFQDKFLVHICIYAVVETKPKAENFNSQS